MKPDPALLAVTNPYSPQARGDVPFPLDVSLHNGKFYLYFGPFPALLMLIPSFFFRGTIGDQYLVFLSVGGISVCQSLLLIKVWQRFFPLLSGWIVAASILSVNLTAPWTAILKGASIYEAAICVGQFLFIAGILAAFDALGVRSTPSLWRLFLAGMLWSAALASRFTLLLPIAFMAVMVVFALIFGQSKVHRRYALILPVMSLGLPLALGLGALGWYNWARFGSPFETGFTYQLAGPLQRHRDEWFSATYVAQNIYNYFGNKPAAQGHFPYLAFEDGKSKPVRSFIVLSKIYSAEKVTGILYTAPFVLFAVAPAILSLAPIPWRRSADDREFHLRWMAGALYGSFLLACITLLAFFWAAERYVVDFLPPLLLSSVFGFWQLLRRFGQQPVWRTVLPAFGICLMVGSIIVSNLLTLGTAALR
jgi:hypothetical protein